MGLSNKEIRDMFSGDIKKSPRKPKRPRPSRTENSLLPIPRDHHGNILPNPGREENGSFHWPKFLVKDTDWKIAALFVGSVYALIHIINWIVTR